jgi:hypothetical protein
VAGLSLTGHVQVAAVSTALGLSLAAAGGLVRTARERRSAKAVTIAVVPDRPTGRKYLPCLAAVGSFTRGLEVLDRDWATRLKAIMEEVDSTNRAPMSLPVRPQNGPPIRFIEVEHIDQLTRPEILRIAQTCHGLLFIDARNAPFRLDFSETPTPPVKASVTIDSAVACDRAGLDTAGALALEAIRRSFTRDDSSDLDWPAVFANLWNPVAGLLREIAAQQPAD